MAIVYGPYDGRARHGIDISMSPSTVTKDTSSVTLTFKVYLQTDRGTTPGYSGTYTLNRTGTGPTGSSSVSVYTYGTTPQLLGTWTQTVSTSYSSSVSRSLTVQFASALFDGARPSATVSFTVPQRPPQLPDTPTSASATYVNDNRINIYWTRPASATDEATIWSELRIYRRSLSNPAWALVTPPLGGLVSLSWSDFTVQPNDSYSYEVRAANAAGESAGAYATWTATTPAAPTAVSAAKDASGDIVVTWQNNAQVAALTGFEVQDETTAVGSPSGSSESFTHVGPNPSVTHRYRVRAVATGPRESAWSAYSNTVQLLTAPNPPSNLTPNGATVDAAGTLTLSWSHNPVDTTPQTAYELDHRLVGAGTWTTASGTTSSSRTLTGYSTGDDVEWRVRTKGAHVDWSPYSATATFSLVSKPTATLSSPGATVTDPAVTVAWAYYQADSHPQSGWEVQILQGTQVIASGTGTNSATQTWTSPAVLQSEQSYDVRVRVRESSGFWSDWDTQTILVQFDPPPVPNASVEWVSSGYYEVTGQAQSGGGAPEPVTLNLERSVNGGPWQTLAEDLGLEFTYFDWTAPMVGYVQYRVTSVSALPSTNTVVVSSLREPGGCGEILLSGGPGMAKVLRFPYYRKRDITSGRERVLNQFDGRPNPVSTSGVFTPLSISVEAVLLPPEQCADGVSTNAHDVVELSEMVGVHYYRDHDGWTFACHLSDVQVNPEYMGAVSFTVTRVDLTDAEAELAIAQYSGPMLVETRPGVYAIVNGSFEETGVATWGLADA